MSHNKMFCVKFKNRSCEKRNISENSTFLNFHSDQTFRILQKTLEINRIIIIFKYLLSDLFEFRGF